MANVSQNGLEELMERRFAGICIFVVTFTENMKTTEEKWGSKQNPTFILVVDRGSVPKECEMGGNGR